MVLLSICILSPVSENHIGVPEMLGFDSFRGETFPILRVSTWRTFIWSNVLKARFLDQLQHHHLGLRRNVNVQVPTQIY